jgi:hypothetical protein
MGVAGDERAARILHSMPARAGYGAINQLATWAVHNQQIVSFAAYDASVLLYYLLVVGHEFLQSQAARGKITLVDPKGRKFPPLP